MTTQDSHPRAYGQSHTHYYLSIFTVAFTIAVLDVPCYANENSVQLHTAGGTMTWALNPGVTAPLGIREPAEGGTSAQFTVGIAGHYSTLLTHIAQTSSFTVNRIGPHLQGISAGTLELHDGPRFLIPGGEADLRLARLKPERPPSFALNVTDRAGNIWARLDHPHYDLNADEREFSMKDFDLRIGPALATALRNASLDGEIIGSASLDLPIQSQNEISMETSRSPVCSAEWPSVSRRVDLQMILLDHDPELGGQMDSVSVMRCGVRTSSGFAVCTPTSTDGLVVIAPDAAAKNVGSTAIVWRPMFSRPGPPYGNDQHPFLIWNLYRIDGDGTFRQIGSSGVKHAYFADNFDCGCRQEAAASPQCKETYAAGTNDTSNVLGPRDEIIPATGLWGRCGSVFDPSCTGHLDTRYFTSDDAYRHRLVVRERDLLPELNPNAKYLFEYEYIVRDQENIEHTIAHRWITPDKTLASGGIRWSVTPTSFANGPALNEWVLPENPALGSMNVRVATPDGHFRVAVRTTKLNMGRYRYDYAVYNEDFARAVLSGTSPNLRVESTIGFTQFRILVPANSHVSDIRFVDADNDLSNDWINSLNDRSVAWEAPKGESLKWGSVYAFSVTAHGAPTVGKVALTVAGAADSESYSANILVPSEQND